MYEFIVEWNRKTDRISTHIIGKIEDLTVDAGRDSAMQSWPTGVRSITVKLSLLAHQNSLSRLLISVFLNNY